MKAMGQYMDVGRGLINDLAVHPQLGTFRVKSHAFLLNESESFLHHAESLYLCQYA